MPHISTTRIGDIIDARYRIEAHLGSGSMGAVFRARHVRLPRSYAIKFLHPHLLADRKLLARFEREATLAGRLSHPNVIGVVDMGEVDGDRFLVMELGAGPTLSEVLAQAPLDPLRACRLIQQICDGLAHAHQHGLIHRDLKPDNIIVETTGGEEVARLVDFGIAILREHTGSERLTTSGLVVGTPHYMAPELACGQPFDHRVDLFALGVICYLLLAGCFPFEGTGVDVVQAYVHRDVPPMTARVPGLAVDPTLEDFTMRLLARRPDDRPLDALAARKSIDDLVRLLHGRPTQPMMPISDEALGLRERLASGTPESTRIETDGTRRRLV